MRLISKVVRNLILNYAPLALVGRQPADRLISVVRLLPLSSSAPPVHDLIIHVLRFVRMTHTFAHYTGNSRGTSSLLVNSGLRGPPGFLICIIAPIWRGEREHDLWNGIILPSSYRMSLFNLLFFFRLLLLFICETFCVAETWMDLIYFVCDCMW